MEEIAGACIDGNGAKEGGDGEGENIESKVSADITGG